MLCLSSHTKVVQLETIATIAGTSCLCGSIGIHAPNPSLKK